MNRSVLRRRSRLPLGCAALGAATVLMGAPASLAQSAADPAAACQKLANLTGFPVVATQITLAKFNPGGPVSTDGVFLSADSMFLPPHCQVQGIINKRSGSDGFPYGDGFELRLPVPADWNRRFMFQGGGGTEGAVPPAIGVAGTASPSATAAARSSGTTA